MLVQENMGDAMLVKKRPVSTDEMNLKSIQRLDPCAIAIIDKVVLISSLPLFVSVLIVVIFLPVRKSRNITSWNC